MCLLINKKAGYVFSHEWLEDFYSHNKDGIGVMWAENGEIHIAKTVPSSLQELLEFHDEHIGAKACSIHFRMRTHGDTDLTNCHPYEVLGDETGYPIYMMHNGVLQRGNSWDTTKSDTWHYINDIIRPALLADPTQFMAPWFKTLIEDNIGRGNKFVLMDMHGNTVTLNESAGVQWEGNWMSNTYAWDARKAGALPPVPAYNYGGHRNYGLGVGYEIIDDWDAPVKKPAPTINPAVDYSDGLGNVPANIVPINGSWSDEYRLRGDAWTFASEFIDILDELGMEEAAMNLSQYHLKEAYMTDPESCNDFLDDIMMGIVTEAEVLEAFGSSHEVEVEDATDNGHLKVGMV